MISGRILGGNEKGTGPEPKLHYKITHFYILENVSQVEHALLNLMRCTCLGRLSWITLRADAVSEGLVVAQVCDDKLGDDS